VRTGQLDGPSQRRAPPKSGIDCVLRYRKRWAKPSPRRREKVVSSVRVLSGSGICYSAQVAVIKWRLAQQATNIRAHAQLQATGRKVDVLGFATEDAAANQQIDGAGPGVTRPADWP
jgi:hypothetical protein